MNVKAFKVAKFLKEQRSKHNWSQPDLAVLLGMNRQSGQLISNIERSLCQLPVGCINKVSELTGVDRFEIAQMMAEDYREAILLTIERQRLTSN